VVFFERPMDKYRTLFEFLKNGLEIGEGAVYVTFSETESKVFNSMERFGIDTARFRREGRLTVMRSTYAPSSRASAEQKWPSLASLRSTFSGLSKQLGNKTLRVASSLSEHLQAKGMIKEVPRVESILRSVARSGRVSVMCAYDSRRLNRPSWFRVFPYLTKVHSRGAFISRKGSIVMSSMRAGEAAVAEKRHSEAESSVGVQSSQDGALESSTSGPPRGGVHESTGR